MFYLVVALVVVAIIVASIQLSNTAFSEREEEVYLTKVIPPRYKHDCRKCKYLGQHKEYDLYHCYNCALEKGTVIARYGNDGWEYASTPILLIDQLPSIYVADSPSGTTRALLKARQLASH